MGFSCECCSGCEFPRQDPTEWVEDSAKSLALVYAVLTPKTFKDCSIRGWLDPESAVQDALACRQPSSFSSSLILFCSSSFRLLR